jgi:hypothetical protein
LYCYADDTTLWYEVSDANRDHVIDQINSDLRLIWDWGIENRTTFEPTKTHYLLISDKKSLKFDASGIVFGDKPVGQVSELKIVGFYFESKMKWGVMVKKLAQKGRSRLAAMFRMKHSLSSENLELMYKAFIRSVMEYGNVSFKAAADSHLKKLDRIQDACCKVGGFVVESLGSRRDASLIGLVLKLLEGDGRGEVVCCTPAPSLCDRSGNWIPQEARCEKRAAAVKSEAATKEVYKSHRPLFDSFDGHQLKITYSVDSKPLYVHSANGSVPNVWSKLPQELIDEGMETWLEVNPQELSTLFNGQETEI